ncbi:hypothetical protein OIU77_005612 [Salix suchowensis]|uniref:Bifunctional lysine-specific demethylase and histidyl-hydroxylase n=1 Tax=Salix suchowensis TaxID=1278906 RepID=A0ABQ9AQ16_9ROSI|nr:hypothetical protein OIU77_005612 [Salix suchowensis]
MEMEDQRDNSKKRTRKRKTSSLLSLNNTTTIFPLLLAAATQLSNSHKNTPNNSSEILVKKCLTKLHQSLLSNIQNFPTSVLSLFPILVNSKCAGIARRSAEIVGLASLVSLDMNELVALDEGIVKGLILMLGSEKRKVSVAACNALLDLSSTLIGRRSLLEFSALEWFILSTIKNHVLPLLHPFFKNSISCVPIASDELNIISFLEEVRSELGCPIVYEQDIRVIRTEQPSKKEVHFFQKKVDPCCFKKPAFNNMDIMQCEEAFKEGYTIALRGVEFRFASIATVADALASLFGQPSVGANIYLTPPNSQGLACHCDDHCVFVCQLFGTKQWSVYPQPNLQLPRLYDRFDRECCLGEQNSLAECRKFLLREGDILYIPRGFPHEACTHDDGSSDLARWEGFAHVALHCWYKTQKQLHGASVEPLSGNLDLMSVTLLHLMIEFIGASDSTLRKASLVGALILPLEIDDWLYLNQKTTFNHIIDQINKASMFLDVFRSVEVVIEKNEDPFHRMRWLRFLYQETETIPEHDWNVPLALGEFQNLFPSCAQHKDMTEAAFMQIKSKFCDEVLFEDVIDSYKLLLEKYKKARKQYMNGMLSLHCNGFPSS